MKKFNCIKILKLCTVKIKYKLNDMYIKEYFQNI